MSFYFPPSWTFLFRVRVHRHKTIFEFQSFNIKYQLLSIGVTLALTSAVKDKQQMGFKEKAQSITESFVSQQKQEKKHLSCQI